MKGPLKSLFVGTAILIAPQIASATLLVGFNDFDDTTNGPGLDLANEPADYAVTGFSGTAIKNTNASVTNGGSSDGYYGPDGAPGFAGLNPGTDNGYMRIYEKGGFPDPVIRFSNISAGSATLTSLLFDAASQLGNTGITIQYRTGLTSTIGSATWHSLGQTPPIPANSGLPGTSVNYSDYAFGLIGVLLKDYSIEFKFGASNARIDNIALTGTLTAIPEAASWLVMGCLVGSGTMLRSRRRTTRHAI